ncbi:MAG: AtpZ/AtpI family protein [bacterium]
MKYWPHLQIGLELAVAVFAGFILGYRADRHFGTAPWLMLVGSAAGLAGGFYVVIKG